MLSGCSGVSGSSKTQPLTVYTRVNLRVPVLRPKVASVTTGGSLLSGSSARLALTGFAEAPPPDGALPQGVVGVLARHCGANSSMAAPITAAAGPNAVRPSLLL